MQNNTRVFLDTAVHFKFEHQALRLLVWCSTLQWAEVSTIDGPVNSSKADVGNVVDEYFSCMFNILQCINVWVTDSGRIKKYIYSGMYDHFNLYSYKTDYVGENQIQSNNFFCILILGQVYSIEYYFCTTFESKMKLSLHSFCFLLYNLDNTSWRFVYIDSYVR